MIDGEIFHLTNVNSVALYYRSFIYLDFDYRHPYMSQSLQTYKGHVIVLSISLF